jgi:hypothetical protein
MDLAFDNMAFAETVMIVATSHILTEALEDDRARSREVVYRTFSNTSFYKRKSWGVLELSSTASFWDFWAVFIMEDSIKYLSLFGMELSVIL